jgi:hypothetical protein
MQSPSETYKELGTVLRLEHLGSPGAPGPIPAQVPEGLQTEQQILPTTS